MTIIEYQNQAKRTCPDLGTHDLNVLHMDLGIMTEVGELLDILKKHIAYKKELDKVHIGEELADACWYLVNKARIEGVSLDPEIDHFNLNTYSRSNNMLYDIADTMIYSMMWLGQYNKFLSVLKAIADHFGLDFYKLLDNNINKLKIRYPEKFTEEQALKRDLNKERVELEK